MLIKKNVSRYLSNNMLWRKYEVNCTIERRIWPAGYIYWAMRGVIRIVLYCSLIWKYIGKPYLALTKFLYFYFYEIKIKITTFIIIPFIPWVTNIRICKCPKVTFCSILVIVRYSKGARYIHFGCISLYLGVGWVENHQQLASNLRISQARKKRYS